MANFRQLFTVKSMSKILGVSRSGFYDWIDRKESLRDIRDKELLILINKIFMESGRSYGRPRIHKALKKRGVDVGPERVSKLMHRANLKPITHRKYKVTTTDSNHSLPISANLVKRNFVTQDMNHVWVSDITYIPVGSKWMYLCVIIDLFSRRVVGWSFDSHMKSDLVCEALERALENRKIDKWELIFHSDRGSQYASHKFRYLLWEHNIRSSMSRKGDCWDNAVAESFFGTIKSELIQVSNYENLQEARSDIFRYIEGFYNRKRLHSYLDYVSPVEFEMKKVAA